MRTANMSSLLLLLLLAAVVLEVSAGQLQEKRLHARIGPDHQAKAEAAFSSTDGQAHHASRPHHQPSLSQPCAPGCELNGNCNRAWGLCECPVGWVGANCSEPLWPSCRISPKQKEIYCSTDWRPKSCACLEECRNFVCPDGTDASCEREFDMYKSKCFQRASNATIVTDGLTWDGGSDLPAEETETGVAYWQGWLKKDARQQITRPSITNVVVEDIGGFDSLIALPIGSCPLQCSLQGSCVRSPQDMLPFCVCHYGFTGEFCEQRLEHTGHQNVCYNKCNGRGTCRRGFCHCIQPGWWGKDCSSSKVFAPHSARRSVNKLRVYVYDLPWTVSYQPEYHLGWRHHDQNYAAYRLFLEQLLKDNVTRTENPWEANMFAIPSESYAFSQNTGSTVPHSKRVIDYVRQQWPFFNRSQGLDHFLWLPGDRGACDVPAEEEPALANVIKVVHFGWHHVSTTHGEPPGWKGHIKNKHWGCFNPLRDIVAAAYWMGQAETANKTYLVQTFDPQHIPKDRLLFFSGGIRLNSPEYSQGVRQQLYRMFGDGSNPQVLIHEGHMDPGTYACMLNTSRFCLAPSGYGWGIRLNNYMLAGCVPVIIQDDIYQAYEDQLPYSEFSVRLPSSSIPDIIALLSEISDEEYLKLRAGMLKFWRAFVWDTAIGGQAYDYMIRSLKDRMLRLQARHYHPVHHSRPQHHHPASAHSKPKPSRALRKAVPIAAVQARLSSAGSEGVEAESSPKS